MAVEPILVDNLAQLNRDLRKTGPAMVTAMRTGLRVAAEPIKRDAESFSLSRIRRMTKTPRKPPPWSIQRIGVTQKEVYMVPKQRGARGRDNPKRRPNFAELMMGRAYDPALEKNRTQVLNRVNVFIGSVTREF